VQLSGNGGNTLVDDFSDQFRSSWVEFCGKPCRVNWLKKRPHRLQ
jgi:hypothetical protein